MPWARICRRLQHADPHLLALPAAGVLRRHLRGRHPISQQRQEVVHQPGEVRRAGRERVGQRLVGEVHFKGRLDDFPLTLAYGKRVDALRDYLWDGEFRDIDLLVNNGGISIPQPFLTASA